MPGALTRTWITWALSLMAPQVSGVTSGSPLCPWCHGHSLWRGVRQYLSYLHLFSDHHIKNDLIQNQLILEVQYLNKLNNLKLLHAQVQISSMGAIGCKYIHCTLSINV